MAESRTSKSENQSFTVGCQQGTTASQRCRRGRDWERKGKKKEQQRTSHFKLHKKTATCQCTNADCGQKASSRVNHPGGRFKSKRLLSLSPKLTVACWHL
ncbi:hypothetical protein BaRGS_00010817 [Batillaria attramentaria]|uniref:Uncharacterized protein n=1 Tax=Batillaria attramentaria TaxID=370345 RepID=A0ABD0LF09_9CAEN